MRKRVYRKKQQHIGIASKQTLLRAQDDRLLPPRTERRKPQIPIEPWLVRRVNPRRPAWVLWLVAERLNEPRFPVVPALKIDFAPSPRPRCGYPLTACRAKRLRRRQPARPPTPPPATPPPSQP